MVFAKYGQSAKTGGFAFSTVIASDLAGNPQILFGDEQANSIEAGFKASLADGAATLNATLFRTEFEDLQVNTFDIVTGAASIQNAAKAVSQGLEIDGVWQIHENFRLFASLGLLDAEFDSFPTAPCPISAQLMGSPEP